MEFYKDLIDLYDNHINDPSSDMIPIGWAKENMNIIITLDNNCTKIINYEIINKNNSRIIPVTASSIDRTTNTNAPHPVFNSICYLSPINFIKKNNVNSYECYISNLKKINDKYHNEKIAKLYNYLSSNDIAKDLYMFMKKRNDIQIPLDESGKFISVPPKSAQTKYDEYKKKYPIFFKNIVPEKQDRAKIFIEIFSNNEDEYNDITKDPEIIKLFSDYAMSTASPKNRKGECMITGKQGDIISNTHKGIPWFGNGKLISSNSSNSAFFSSYFSSLEDCAYINAIDGLKISNALSFLVKHNSLLAKNKLGINNFLLLIYSTDFKYTNHKSIFDDDFEIDEKIPDIDSSEKYSKLFNNAFYGYNTDLDELDAKEIKIAIFRIPTKGRASIVYYNSLSLSKYLDYIKNWHNDTEWNFSYVKNEEKHIDALGTKSISNMVYDIVVPVSEMISKKQSQGTQKLISKVYYDIFTSFIQNKPIKKYIIDLAKKKLISLYSKNKNNDYIFTTKNLFSMIFVLNNINNKEKYKLYTIDKSNKYNKKIYIDENNTSRSYLYGRLLAVVDSFENSYLAKTNKVHSKTILNIYMNNILKNPSSTWLNIMRKINNYNYQYSKFYLHQINEIISLFNEDDFNSNSSIMNSSDFFYGFACQSSQIKENNRISKLEKDNKQQENN